MSSFGGLSTALSSLQAQRKAMEVTGQNVANASTTGYTRQRVELKALGPAALYSLQGSVLSPGSGVMVTGISRLADDFASARLRSATSDSGYLSARADALGQVEARFAEPSDSGLAAQLSELWKAWGDVSNTPDQGATRSALVQQSVTVVGELRAGHAGVATQWQQTRSQAVSTTAEVNDLATSVAQLNHQIRAAQGSENPANELVDQRDQLVLRLSELTGAGSQAMPDGTVRVLIGGSALVDGDRVNAVALAAPNRLQDVTSAAPARLTWSDGSAVEVSGGTTAGLLETLQTTLPAAAAGYDAVAVALAAQVNALHSGGKAPDGSTGRDFFVFTGTGTGAAQIDVNPDLVTDPLLIAAASATGGAKDGTLADQIAALKGSTTGPDAVWKSFVVRTGVESATAARRADVVAGVVTTASTQLMSTTGVDIDEEMANLQMFQRAYEGAARVLTAVDEALDQLINRTGLVGR